MKKLLEENETLMQIVNDAGRPPAHDSFSVYETQYISEKIW